MATIKFSEFDAGNINAGGAQIVGLEGGTNKRFTAADLVNGLASTTYVDAQDLNLQNQITQNTDDIANLDLAGLESNVSALQGQVTVLQGNIVVLEGAVAALENNVNVNQDEITTIQGNITLIEQQIADLQANGNVQSLSLDNSSNVLTISGGNSVDFTPVLANVAGDPAQTLSLNNTSNVLTISDGNNVDLSPVLANVSGGGGGGNPFDQDLNTTDSPTFDNLTTTGELDINGSGTHTFEGTLEFTQLTNFGGTVGITNILDEDNMVSDSATALATQQSIKAYVDASVVSGGGYSNAVVTSYAEAGWQGNIIPSANITYDLGSPTNAWKDLYLSNSTIYLGSQTISVENDGTIAFSGNISAPAIVDYTQLILNDGVLTTSRAGSTDGLEWESVVIPSSADGARLSETVGNDSGIVVFTRDAEITYSLDNGVTWQIVNIIDDLGYTGFDRYDVTKPYYSPGLDLFYIFGSDGYYFTTSDFQTYSGQQLANVNWGDLSYESLQVAESDTRLLVVEPTSRKAYYADIATPTVWTEVNNLGLGNQNGVDVHYTGSAFVIISIGEHSCRVSTDNGVTWSNGGDIRGGVSGNYYISGSDIDPDTGTILVGLGFNRLSVSTDSGSSWTMTDMNSVFTIYPSNAVLRNISYGAGLWCVNAVAAGGGDDWFDRQYVSEDISDLSTWKIIYTNVPGYLSLDNQTYVNGNFWSTSDKSLFKLEWPVGTQVLLFNDEVIATRKDLAYVAVAHEQAQAEKVATKELEVLSRTYDANANVVQSSTLTYESNALHISGDVEVEGNINILGNTNKQEYVDIRDYGAVGGNATLDTQAWDDALDDIVAAGGGILVLPRISQRYHINVTTPDKDNTPQSRNYSNVTIRGGGEIYIEQVNGCLVHIGENTDNFLIEDLDILIAASASGGGYGKGTILSQYGNINRVTIRDMTIKNEPKPDADGGPFLINFSQEVTDPTDTDEIQNVTVENCDLEVYGRANYGIRFIRKSKFSKVLNNRITLHAWQNPSAQSFNAIAMYGWAEEFLIQGNSIFGSGHSAIAVSMAFNGIVKENFVKNVTNPVEGGIEVENKWGHARDDVLYTTNGIKVVNNIVQDCEYGIMVTNRNPDEPTSRATYDVLIDGNSVYNSESSDIIVYDKLSGTPATANTHTDIRITNNSCFSNAPNGGIRMYTGKDSAINANHVRGQNVGIHVGRSSSIFVQGFINILGNTVEDHTTHGIHVESGNAILRVSENNVSNVVNRGFLLSTCQGGTHIYNNNYVQDTGQDAYYIRANPENRKGSMFRGNRAFRAGSRGFYVDMYDSIISENIDVDSSTTNTFTNNANTTVINNLSF